MRRASPFVRAALRSLACLLAVPASGDLLPSPAEPPPVGFAELRVLTPLMLEAFLVSTEAAAPDARPSPWDWVDEAAGTLRASFPAAEQITITCDGELVRAKETGFRRISICAPLPNKVRGGARDLRIGNSLFIALEEPLPVGARVEVRIARENPQWPADLRFSTRVAADRENPAIHVSQTGYEPRWTKRAQVGYFCGTLGELPVEANRFEVIAANDGTVAFTGSLQRRPDVGFTVKPPPYQQVFELDFTPLAKPGEYWLYIPQLGRSHPFRIADGVSGALARALSLGVFHQRDGVNQQELPWTRFIDGPAHLKPAEILTVDPSFKKAWGFVAGMSAPSKEQSAPPLRDFTSALYPPLLQGSVDVTGGHRDAGDYSKYLINSAAALAVLSFAAESLGEVGTLDNLGTPESGDGISDVLQEAKFEADFIAKMQDADGGFWFLVYPKNRAYEGNVLPSGGDAQVLFPKNTSATAAAVGALAQAAASSRMKSAYPEASALYRKKAQAGWDFLERAIAAHGRDGAYQKITHYGDEFRDRDELAFAAAGMFALTGDSKFESALKELVPDPGSESVRRWTWWPLFESYGHAFRAYAFASRRGLIPRDDFDPVYLGKIEAALLAGGEAALKSSRECAYGTSYDQAFKRPLNAGYHFSLSIAFDLAVAAELTKDISQRNAFREAVLANGAYTSGSNPVNLCFVTGLGWKRVQNVVSQFAQNSPRALPPTGLPVGEISDGPYSFDPYRTPKGQNLLSQLIFPSGRSGTPIYDRWIDSFHVGNEATIVEQTRAAAAALWLFSQSDLRAQKWQAPRATILSHGSTMELKCDGVNLSDARVLWELAGKSPCVAGAILPQNPTGWVEAEADFPDGRRVFARRE